MLIHKSARNQSARNQSARNQSARNLCNQDIRNLRVRNRITQVSVAISLGFLMVSCAETKASQCNKLIEVANQAVTEVQTVSQNPKPDNVEAMNKIADAADKAKTDMGGVQLSDDQLKEFQGRFVSMYTETSQATRDLIAAAEAKDAEAAQKAFDALKTATDKESPLVQEVNTYCAK